jgi:tRNA threonylcarbamoyladenosine biosynthesis protein TsaB
MTPLLAFDTSTEVLAVALAAGGRVRTANAPGGAQASARLLPLARALLAEAGLDWPALRGIAFGRGPGAFTGLRTSCAVAQGLAFGLNVPVWPLDSLAVVAEDARVQLAGSAASDVSQQANDVASVHAAVLADARMGEVYAGAWHWRADAGWRCVVPPRLADPGELDDLFAVAWPDAAASRIACGSALAVPALRERWRWPADVRALGNEQDRAAAVLRLALHDFDHEAGLAADDALPLYLRDKVAQTTAERAALRGAVGAGPTQRWRPMTTADLDRVMAVEVRCYSHPWSRGNFEDSLRSGYLAEVAEAAENEGGELLAYQVAMKASDELHLLNLTVAPERQRRGLGRAALERLGAHAARLGAGSLWLEVRESNARARAVYRAAGWQEVGRRRGYYPGVARREDAVLMRCDRPPLPRVGTGAGMGAGHAVD